MFEEKSLVRQLRRAFGSGVVGVAFIAVPAIAQEVQRGEKVEVTGSSIKRIDAETALPVQVITRQDINRLAPQNTEDLLKSLSVTNTTLALQLSTGSGAATSGASTVSLRGLGAQRTLVLVNGRRIAPFGGVAGGGANTSVDVNSIPIAAIERIEVLKDGASSLYGSDAIGGVINFILRKDYVGFEAGAQYGQTTHSGDGRAWSVDGLVGFGDLNKDRFNVMVNASHTKEDAIYGRQRNFANSSINVGAGNDTTSGNTYPANIVDPNGASRNFLAPRFAPQVANGTFPTFGFTNCSPSLASPLFPNNRCRFDPAPLVALIPQSERTSVNISGRFVISPEAELYGEIGGSKNVIKYTIQPTPISDQFNLPAGNPYIPVLDALIKSYNPALQNTYGPGGVYDTLFKKNTFLLPTTSPYYPTAFAASLGLAGVPLDLRYRAFENGLRSLKDDNTAARVLGGIKGTISGWDYDSAILYTESKVRETPTGGYPISSKILTLLNTGVVNPFGPSTPAVQQQILATNFSGEAFNSKTSAASIDAKASREIFQLPAGPLALAVGGELRKEKYAFNASQAIATGNVEGYGGNFVNEDKSRNVEGVFAEVNVPILKGLEGNVAVRYDNYQHVDNTTNPKASLRWQPVRELLLRASVGTGFRAPSLPDLFAPQTEGVSQNGLSDPLRCPTTGSSTDCATQFTTVNGGTASLKPEKSSQKSLGFVLEPTSNVHFGADYFDINLRNQIVIGGIGATAILADVTSVTRFSNLVTRGAPSNGLPGPIISIDQHNQNLDKIHIQGIDIDFKTRVVTNTIGKYTFSLNGTYFTRYDSQNPDRSYTGLVADANAQTPLLGSVIPRWKHIASVSWDYGPWNALVAQNFQSAYNDLASTITGDTRRVGVYETFDLQGSYTGIKGLTLTAGIKNVFDKDPPYSNVGGQVFFQAGYDASYADVRGRFIYGNVRYAFK